MEKDDKESVELLDNNTEYEDIVENKEVEDTGLDDFDNIVEKEDNDKVFDEIVEEKTEEEKPIKKDSDYTKNTKALKVFVFVVCFIFIIFGCIKFFGSDGNKSTSKRYEINSYDDNKEYKPIKQLSIDDSIILRNVTENKDILYNFKVTKGKVTVTNDYCTYEFKGIEDANKLVVNTMGNLLEDTGVFIVTSDGKLYSISLYDDKSNLVVDCSSFEDKIDKYDLSFKVKNIESGFYSNKDGSGMEGIILITDTNDDNHVLATIKNKSVK